MDCTQLFIRVSALPGQIVRLQRELDNCPQPGEPPERCDELEQEIQTLQTELESLLPLQSVCEVIVGSYNFDGNGFTGTIQLSADISLDKTAHITGIAVIDAPHRDTIDGSYDGNTGVLRFTRTGDDNNARFQPQQYFGRLFARQPAGVKTTFAGVYATGAPPALDSQTKGWFMTKQ